MKSRVIRTIGLIFVAISFAGCHKEVAQEPLQNQTSQQLPVIVIESDSTFSDNAKSLEAEAGEAVDELGESDFYIKKIDDVILARMRGKSYKDDCPIPIEDLRYIHILHKDITGKTLEGELVVNSHIAEDVLEIFKELYEVSYPIEKVRLVDEYGGDDELSMEDNNSSAFNYRSMMGSTKISKHGLGMAIDINTLYNPYVKETAEGTVTEPVTATEYVNREGEFDYKINKDDEAYRIFTEHGFEWGGNWKSVKDYQHFEVPTDVIRSIYAWY